VMGLRHAPEDIMVAVRWFLRYGLSYRDVEELWAERGVEVDHVTVYLWVQRFTPLLIDAVLHRGHYELGVEEVVTCGPSCLQRAGPDDLTTRDQRSRPAPASRNATAPPVVSRGRVRADSAVIGQRNCEDRRVLPGGAGRVCAPSVWVESAT
jgi:hypothetical protein